MRNLDRMIKEWGNIEENLKLIPQDRGDIKFIIKKYDKVLKALKVAVDALVLIRGSWSISVEEESKEALEQIKDILGEDEV